jgi:hypothetical protein
VIDEERVQPLDLGPGVSRSAPFNGTASAGYASSASSTCTYSPATGCGTTCGCFRGCRRSDDKDSVAGAVKHHRRRMRLAGSSAARGQAATGHDAYRVGRPGADGPDHLPIHLCHIRHNLRFSPGSGGQTDQDVSWRYIIV